MRTWVKLYTEINRDPKIGQLTWAQRGMWSALLALGGEIDDEGDEGPTGRLDTVANVAWHLRCELGELEDALRAFAERDMVRADDGVVYLVHFGSRQRKAPSDAAEIVAERVRRHRSTVKRGCNEDVTSAKRGVTSSETETETETEAETETGSDADADAERASAPEPPPLQWPVDPVIRAWENVNGLVTPTAAALLSDMETEYGPEWVTDAITEAAKASNRFAPRYVEVILQRWRREGKGSKNGKAQARASPQDRVDAVIDEWLKEGGDDDEKRDCPVVAGGIRTVP